MEDIKCNGLDVLFVKGFLNKEQADWFYNYCLGNVVWGQDEYNFNGKVVLSPRMTSLYGDKSYSYSGQKLKLNKLTTPMERIIQLLNEKFGYDFNVILFNHYRDGSDSVSWHTDAEKELGNKPVIASLSLGGSKVFKMREIADKSNKRDFLLENGDLLIMRGDTQKYWEHSVPKTKKHNDSRINLTIRKIL